MSDKPNPAATLVAAALADHRLLQLAGRDAVAFLQAQAMNDVAALADGQWQWNGWLTPKGRTVALFALLRRDSETLWLLLPDQDPQALADALRRYVFRSKVAIAVRDDLVVSGAFAAPTRARGAQAAVRADGGVELDFGGDGGPRLLAIAAAAADADAALAERWRAFDIAHGWPRLAAAQRERWTPQQLSLERLQAFSVHKGCYPGQEIVARTHFLGQVRRGLVALRAPDAAPRVGDVQQDGNTIGRLVCAAQDLRLAVLPLERAETPLTVDGLPLEPVALLGGLAR